MTVFLMKSLLAVALIASVFVALYTMLEVFGRAEKKYNIERLKKIHRFNGFFYILLFSFIAYFCFAFIASTKTDLSARAAFHAVFALSIMVLLGLKIAFVEIYRQFYGKVQTIGLTVAFLSFLLAGTSAGYYLLITKFGAEVAVVAPVERKEETAKPAAKLLARADADSIRQGKELYEEKCFFCHDAYSTKTEVGPGHKGILKNPLLPVSKKPATPESVANQIRRPYRDMPAFDYFTDDQVMDLVAFLNTL